MKIFENIHFYTMSFIKGTSSVLDIGATAPMSKEVQKIMQKSSSSALQSDWEKIGLDMKKAQSQGIKNISDSTIQVKTQTSSFAGFSGPIPLPAIIDEYERILPGAAEKIFKWAEDETAHRHKNESLIIESEITLLKVLLLSFSLSL